MAQSTAMSKLDPVWFTVLRLGLASLALAPFAVVEQRRSRRALSGHDWLWLMALGTAFFVGTILQQIALVSTSVTHVGFLTGLYVLFVPCLEVVVFRRRPSAWIWPAAFLALAGTWFLGDGLGQINFGDALTIAAALCFAVQIMLLEFAVARTGRPATVAGSQAICCIVFGLPFAIVRPLDGPSIIAAAPELLYAGVLSGGVAFALQALGQQFAPASEAAIILMSEALFAAAFAALLLNERLTGSGLLGCSLVFTSLVLVQLGPIVQQRRTSASLPLG